jgi:hypothetical protein
MHAADAIGLRQIGDRPGDAQDAGIAARRQPHRFGCLREQGSSGIVGRGHRLQQVAVDLGIGPRSVTGVAGGLDRARGGDPRRDLGRSFGRRRQDEVGGADRLDFDVEVDPVP